jgi:hypothetical protein
VPRLPDGVSTPSVTFKTNKRALILKTCLTRQNVTDGIPIPSGLGDAAGRGIILVPHAGAWNQEMGRDLLLDNIAPALPRKLGEDYSFPRSA